MHTNEEIMLRCLRLAARGMGNVSPNPMVGCVIMKNGEIIGEGYHEKFGGPHAEVNAIRAASAPVEGAEVFVNLEPCSYYGKTPPCVDLLIEKRVAKVHIAMLDPNPRVNGSGVEKLREAGVEVEIGLLAEEAHRLNEAFVKYVSKKLPYVTLKIAQSLDGRIALANGKSKYITSRESLTRVHALRSEHDAVLVGAGTIRTDDPSLTVRLVEGKSPARIILDGNLSSPLKSTVFNDKKSRVIVIHSTRAGASSSRKMAALRKLGVELHSLPADRKGRLPIRSVLRLIARLGIASVMVEGGVEVFSELIRSGMADRLHLFIAPVIIGKGKAFADLIELTDLKKARRLGDIQTAQVGPDIMITGGF